VKNNVKHVPMQDNKWVKHGLCQNKNLRMVRLHIEKLWVQQYPEMVTEYKRKFLTGRIFQWHSNSYNKFKSRQWPVVYELKCLWYTVLFNRVTCCKCSQLVPCFNALKFSTELDWHLSWSECGKSCVKWSCDFCYAQLKLSGFPSRSWNGNNQRVQWI